ncbi:MAG TPA: Coenzyme F420 hydrogenase/dehydrogenase, beta subunit C-terminal domain [Devosia sp.]|nr:Coenzyme F420 hydrogenase/dehydrogenase, beta subunit C-terminal domain [Devosia sp.]
MPSSELLLSPRDIGRSGLCIGCGGCASQLPGISLELDAYGQFKPAGEGAAKRSATLTRVCPFSPAAANEDQIGTALFPDAPHDPQLGRWEAAFVGAVTEPGFRDSGSSGGLTSWVICELLQRGLIDGVAHVGPREGNGDEKLFGYRISRTVEDIRARAKSRYFPVEMSGVLDEIRRVPGRYAVVGIPCFIKAVNLLRREDAVLRERIVFTVGLVCGHMKSARMAESFTWQLGARMEEVERFDFRRKDTSRPANWYRTEAALRSGETRAEDWWNLADGDWGAGFFQNPACNFCDDVVAETADIVFGDAWVEPYQNDGRGTNVGVVRNKQLQRILAEAQAEGRISIEEVDADFVVRTQAAGFRQRREGLAYRLAHRWHGIMPVKRVAPRHDSLPWRRKLVYRMRQTISRWSHRVFWLARTTGQPKLYTGWAKRTLRLYQALTYSRGRLGAWIDRVAAFTSR